MNIGLSLSDLSEEMGFINGYTEDINRPYLRQHLFLMYRVDLTSTSFINLDERFRMCNRLHNRRIIYIDKTPYILYTFNIIGRTLLDILEGKVPYKNDEYLQIHKFWNFTDDFINELLCNRSLIYKTNDPEAIVPEEDYMSDETEEEYLLVKQKNPGTLQQNVRVYLFKNIGFIHHIDRQNFNKSLSSWATFATTSR